MQIKPFEYQPQCPPWHFTTHDTVFNSYLSLIIIIPHMKVWRIVVINIHVNDDSIEFANLRHICFC